VHKLKRVIRDQLYDDMSRSTFDIGYIHVQGSHTVTIRSKEDLLEV
jgi:hypothetical protein